MRLSMEPILFQYGMDMSFSGHIHTYERSNRVYDYKVNACGAHHVLLGTPLSSPEP
jgi:acid phosphatase type 7